MLQSSIRKFKEKMMPNKQNKEAKEQEDYEISFSEPGLKADPEVNKRLRRAGFTNAQAQLVYDLAAEKMMPLAQEMAEELAQKLGPERELAELVKHYGGENRWQRVAKQLMAWGKQNLPKEVFEALCCSSRGVLALDKMMREQEPKTLPKKSEEEQPDETDLRKLIASPSYWRDKDPRVLRQVAEGFSRLNRP